MLNLTKLEKEKILKYFYKNYQNINFDNIDKDDFFKKNTRLNEKVNFMVLVKFFYKKNINHLFKNLSRK